MKEVDQDTIVINDIGKEAVQDPGEFTTLSKSNRNTTRLKKPKFNHDTVHYSIVYRSGTAI
eukprot:10851231-Ditylum_brightwellii.AAC.1